MRTKNAKNTSQMAEVCSIKRRGATLLFSTTVQRFDIKAPSEPKLNKSVKNGQ